MVYQFIMMKSKESKRRVFFIQTELYTVKQMFAEKKQT